MSTNTERAIVVSALKHAAPYIRLSDGMLPKAAAIDSAIANGVRREQTL